MWYPQPLQNILKLKYYSAQCSIQSSKLVEKVLASMFIKYLSVLLLYCVARRRYLFIYLRWLCWNPPRVVSLEPRLFCLYQPRRCWPGPRAARPSYRHPPADCSDTCSMFSAYFAIYLPIYFAIYFAILLFWCVHHYLVCAAAATAARRWLAMLAAEIRAEDCLLSLLSRIWRIFTRIIIQLNCIFGTNKMLHHRQNRWIKTQQK